MLYFHAPFTVSCSEINHYSTYLVSLKASTLIYHRHAHAYKHTTPAPLSPMHPPTHINTQTEEVQDSLRQPDKHNLSHRAASEVQKSLALHLTTARPSHPIDANTQT